MTIKNIDGKINLTYFVKEKENMKKTLLALAGIAMLLSFVGCKTTEIKDSDLRGKGATVATPKRKIVDYKGQVFGTAIPEWVIACVEGETAKLPKLMIGLEDTKVFVATERGKNLNFVKTWAENVGINKKIAAIFETVIATSTSTSLEGTADEKKTELTQTINDMTEALASVRLTGIEQKADYWVEIEEYDNNGKVVDSFFEYYVVAAMDMDAFEDQYENAMKGITDVTTEAGSLKEILRGRLVGDQVSDDIEDYGEYYF